MTAAPPPYPRIPYLAAHPSRPRGDDVLSKGERERLLRGPCVVEEKLDGANVALWISGRSIEVAGRGGRGAMDRGDQLGRLKAWARERDPELRRVLGDQAKVIYAEWLWRTHTIHYEALPDLLVVLDLIDRSGVLVPAERRDAICATAGFATPPCIFRGAPRTTVALDALVGPSTFGAEQVEGFVVRAVAPDAPTPRAKYLAPGFRPVSDDAFARRGLVLNEVRASRPGPNR